MHVIISTCPANLWTNRSKFLIFSLYMFAAIGHRCGYFELEVENEYLEIYPFRN